jgi:hypothetical protein
MKIIKLTEHHGEFVYLNPNYIVFFERNTGDDATTSIFFIEPVGEHSFFEVFETPEEIIELIKQSETI